MMRHILSGTEQVVLLVVILLAALVMWLIIVPTVALFMMLYAIGDWALDVVRWTGGKLQ